MDVGKCSELRDKEICDAVKTCGDLYGEAENMCLVSNRKSITYEKY